MGGDYMKDEIKALLLKVKYQQAKWKHGPSNQTVQEMIDILEKLAE